MASRLVSIEPIKAPDVRQVAKLCSLPQWVEERLGVLKNEPQPDETGRTRMVWVLPMSSILDRDQKSHIERHMQALQQTLAMTPIEDPKCAEVTMVTVSKMALVLAGRENGEFAAEARGEAYMDALEDVPAWAVQEAIRKWYRAEHGARHDYKWQPDPATLRQLAQVEVLRVRGTVRRLGNLVAAQPELRFSEEHMTDMKEKLSALARGALSVDRSDPKAGVNASAEDAA